MLTSESWLLPTPSSSSSLLFLLLLLLLLLLLFVFLLFCWLHTSMSQYQSMPLGVETDTNGTCFCRYNLTREGCECLECFSTFSRCCSAPRWRLGLLCASEGGAWPGRVEAGPATVAAPVLREFVLEVFSSSFLSFSPFNANDAFRGLMLADAALCHYHWRRAQSKAGEVMYIFGVSLRLIENGYQKNRFCASTLPF